MPIFKCRGKYLDPLEMLASSRSKLFTNLECPPFRKDVKDNKKEILSKFRI